MIHMQVRDCEVYMCEYSPILNNNEKLRVIYITYLAQTFRLMFLGLVLLYIVILTIQLENPQNQVSPTINTTQITF